ncbi:hypothetical protein F5B18DRAFT_610517, partial [Nemania serpens]
MYTVVLPLSDSQQQLSCVIREHSDERRLGSVLSHARPIGMNASVVAMFLSAAITITFAHRATNDVIYRWLVALYLSQAPCTTVRVLLSMARRSRPEVDTLYAIYYAYLPIDIQVLLMHCRRRACRPLYLAGKYYLIPTYST